jgi:L-lysine 6-oxidase
VVPREVRLDPFRDETAGGGCEPGDLTKRTNPPWQTDYNECGNVDLNFSVRPFLQEDNMIPAPPSFQTFFWPAQFPGVVHLSFEHQGNRRDTTSPTRGQPDWFELGFVVNQVRGRDSTRSPFYAEQERVERAASKGAAPASETTQASTSTPMPPSTP